MKTGAGTFQVTNEHSLLLNGTTWLYLESHGKPTYSVLMFDSVPKNIGFDK
jgi:hypothetical protein